jgi:hypothetical protein
MQQAPLFTSADLVNYVLPALLVIVVVYLTMTDKINVRRVLSTIKTFLF